MIASNMPWITNFHNATKIQIKENEEEKTNENQNEKKKKLSEGMRAFLLCICVKIPTGFGSS